ncbi:head-tail connector protein [uncultured Duncaniella sp.]|jgi:hypothetical protein|uniref:head-tail connector protein n=1 Tax=uncultured Duncaniella sp. TaxID=2768039 RepID=UPI0026E93B7F|nr:head-tail connector protein [uncultured Duncaniella sp.]
MRFLTLDFIKQHCNVDYDDDDLKLEAYGNAAEGLVMRTLGRTEEELYDMGDGVNLPGEVLMAMAMVVAHNLADPEGTEKPCNWMAMVRHLQKI